MRIYGVGWDVDVVRRRNYGAPREWRIAAICLRRCGIVRAKSSKEEVNVKSLFSRVGVVALLALGIVVLCNSAAQAEDAAATYKAKCAMCHGPDGKGSATGLKMGAHDFSSAEVQKETDAQLTEIIAKGKGKMPAYDGKLKDTEIKELVAYVRSLGKK